MSKQDAVEMLGVVMQELGRGLFRVGFANGHEALCTLSGKVRSFHIRCVAGDAVTVALSPYDLTRGRITFRHNKAAA